MNPQTETRVGDCYVTQIDHELFTVSVPAQGHYGGKRIECRVETDGLEWWCSLPPAWLHTDGEAAYVRRVGIDAVKSYLVSKRRGL